MPLRETWELIKETFNEWLEDDVSRLAAALAFYTIFSLAPVLIIIVAILSVLFGEESARAKILEQSLSIVGTRGTQIIATALENARNNATAATVIGIAGMLFGATAAFANLQEALNSIWGLAPKPGWQIWPMFRKRLLSFVMILIFGGILLSSLVVSTAIAAVSEFATNALPIAANPLAFLDFLTWLTILSFCFAMTYKVLPDAKVGWPDVWLGGAVASILFTVGKTLIGFYLAHSTVTSAFGAAGSLVAFLMWIYYSAQIFLLGGEFTQVHAKRRGAGIVPDENAVRVERRYLKAS